MKLNLIGLCTLLVITGCAHFDEAILDGTKREPTHSVEFYRGMSPTNNFHCIALLTVLGDSKHEMAAVNYFVSEGKHLGGDAVVMEWPLKRHGFFRAYVVINSATTNEQIKF
jgi:hypothetical protein